MRKIVSDNSFTNKGHRVRPLSIDVIRSFAIRIRKIVYPFKSLIIDGSILLEHSLPQVLKGFSFDILENHEINVPARSFPNKNFIEFRENTYEGIYHNNPRDVFTLIHELGHLLMHKGEFGLNRERIHKPYEDSEWQADTFAGEFLMPINLISQYSSSAEISENLGVSRQAAKVRIEKLKKNAVNDVLHIES